MGARSDEHFDSLDDAVQAVADLRATGNQVYWELGDLVNAARATFGLGSLQALAGATGYRRPWLSLLGQVSAFWPEDERDYATTWDTYHVAAGMGTEAKQWLNTARINGWSAADLRRAIVKARGGTSQDSKQSAVRFCNKLPRLWPHIRKSLPARRLKPWQEEWYNLALADVEGAMMDWLIMAKAFEASRG